MIAETLTLRLFDGSYVALELVESLDVFLLFNTIEYNAASCLKVCHTILERHSANCDTRIHFIVCKIESPDSSSVYSTSFLLQPKNELNSLDFGCSGYSAGRKDRAECIEAAEASAPVETRAS